MTACKGNFNLNTIQKQESYKTAFYKEDGNLIMLKGNAGDSSDFTMVSKDNDKNLLAMSSKSLTKETSGGLDIEKMAFYAQKYIDTCYKITYGFVVKNKKQTDDMIRRTHKSSKELADIYYKNGLVHKDSEPAIEYKNGTKFWYKNGQIHRENGPAWIMYDENGTTEIEHYYLNDIEITNEFQILTPNGNMATGKDPEDKETEDPAEDKSKK
jgi:hypothetical protein